MGKDVYTPLWVKDKLQRERTIRILGIIAAVLFFSGYLLMGSETLIDIREMQRLMPLYLYVAALVSLIVRWRLQDYAR